MNQSIHVHLLASIMPPDTVAGGTAVIIDVLRASTTMVHALAHGARAVVPCASVEEAQQAAKNYDPAKVLKGGERHGTLIAGFDLDNSPLAYTPAKVAGKTIVFTTTNGTAALRQSAKAERILIGSLVNLTAVGRDLASDSRPIHLVCAGTDGRLTAEDILCAGGLVEHLIGAHAPATDEAEIDVQAQMALDFYRARAATPERLHKTMTRSLGARNLLKLGLASDIERSSEIDRFSVVPAWDRTSNELRID